jgi:hypothetical protein
MTIAQFVPSLAELKKLTLEEQSCLLLRRLATLNGGAGSAHQGFHKGNLRLRNAMSLAVGFPQNEQPGVTDLLIAAPWQRLVNDGLIVDTSGQNFFYLTAEGRQAAIDCEKGSNVPVDRMVLSALELLHPDFSGYAHYFRAGKLKEAVAAAFERYENRLNEIRDHSHKKVVKAIAGQSLVYALFREKVLRFPCPSLSKRNRADLEKSLQSMLSGALGWIRNPYTHEKHHLPEIDSKQALELLFVASYLMRTIEQSVRASKPKGA